MNPEQQTQPCEPGTGIVAWKSPSNIAIIKYWGKHGEQLPSNPSLSLTLKEAYTTTRVEYVRGTGRISFYFEGKLNQPFASRVTEYILRLTRDNAFLSGLDYEIRSQNSFPHSAGIASSASAMSALALCIGSIVYANEGKEIDDNFWKMASYNARLGSGSASRSIRGPVVIWGEVEGVPGSSDHFAVEAPAVHPVFNTFKDTILLIDRDEKQVKSSVGHALMHNHPYATERFKRARAHMNDLLFAMKTGDVQLFGKIAEAEALDLHGMMMTSTPPYLLIKPNTLAVINALYKFRADTGLPVYMTLDAGPNVHLLYPEEIAAKVNEWTGAELKQYCIEGQMIHDHVGNGAEKIAP
jgi:diphosphomevalonate decarboxylase